MAIQEYDKVMSCLDRGLDTASKIADEMGWPSYYDRAARTNKAYNICKKLEKWGKIERIGMDGQSIVWRKIV